jgi:hypothetical protein
MHQKCFVDVFDNYSYIKPVAYFLTAIVQRPEIGIAPNPHWVEQQRSLVWS